MIKTALLATVLVAGAATACSSSTSGSSDDATTGLSGALASINAPASTSGGDEIQYGDLARQRKLGIINPAGVTDRSVTLIAAKWNTVAAYGTGRLATLAAVLPKAIGLNVFDADTAVTAGMPPNAVLRVSGGVDTGAVTSKLKGLGAKPRSFAGQEGLSLGADNSIDRTSPLAGYGVVNELDQVVADGSTFSAAANATALERSVGKGTSLLDTGDYRAVATCLGKVIAADIYVAAKPGNSTLVAVGERDPGTLTSAPHEVVCLLPADGKKDVVAKSLAANLALTARDPATDVLVSSFATASTFDTSGPLVRATLTLKAGGQVGYVFQALKRNVTGVWDGTCSVSDLRQRRTC